MTYLVETFSRVHGPQVGMTALDAIIFFTSYEAPLAPSLEIRLLRSWTLGRPSNKALTILEAD
jgi:hypothetical protein